MDIFETTLRQMLVLFSFILIGYMLKKRKILSDNADNVLSRLETYVLLPALVINNLMTRCTIENLSVRISYLIYGAVLIFASWCVATVLCRLVAKDQYTFNIYKYSFTIANFSFVGNAVVNGVFGSDVLFEYLIFCIPLTLYCYSMGVSWLMPKKENNKGFSFKVFVNPTVFALIIGIFLGMTQLKLPQFLNMALESASNCMSPVAMILTGFVIGGYDIKKLVSMPVIYFISIVRLIAIPAIFILILRLFNTSQDIILVALCSLAMPLGLNTIVYPAAYGGDTKLGAGMALVSSIMSIATIPLVFMLLL